MENIYIVIYMNISSLCGVTLFWGCFNLLFGAIDKIHKYCS